MIIFYLLSEYANISSEFLFDLNSNLNFLKIYTIVQGYFWTIRK